ncbi:oligogalacturonate-specific porin KdgM family protein [Erwinia sp. AnSW2-5]|uniref:oligogalacturonate-specific porin KdgM family protein n=1 Tax=Erwinia sp. AnSW2-5 TaxID=3367692 RepID=UPI00385986B6
MKNNRLLLCGLLLASASSQAVTLDVRHEWLDDSKQHKDRFMVSHRFDNGIGFSLEAKWKSGGDNQNKAFTDLVDSGTESTVSYQYKVTPAWFLQPGFTLESSSDNSIYKPFLTTGYQFDNGIYFNVRYRYEYTRSTKENTDDKKTNRGEFWLGYRLADWRFEYNYIYKHSDQVLYDNDKWDYEQDLKVAYNINKQWTPYVEVGDVSVSKTADDRQTRLRIGVQYSF